MSLRRRRLGLYADKTAETLLLSSDRSLTLKSTWTKSVTCWMVSVIELLVRLPQQHLDVPNCDLHTHGSSWWKHFHQFISALFFQWRRPTCRSTRTRTGCHLSRFVVYPVYFFRCLVSLCVSHTSSRLLRFRDALSVLSPAQMRWWMWSMRANLTVTLLLPVSPCLTVLLIKPMI